MKKKIRNKIKNSEIELNVMPFIDVFSLLCIFLLSSAIFLSVGTHRVQIPFLSNAQTSSSIKTEDIPDLNLSVSVSKILLEIKEGTKEVRNKNFDMDDAGLRALHAILLSVKESSPKAEKITVFFTNDVIYEDVIRILDVVKFKKYNNGSASNTLDQNGSSLFAKVVFGSILN